MHNATTNMLIKDNMQSIVTVSFLKKPASMMYFPVFQESVNCAVV